MTFSREEIPAHNQVPLHLPIVGGISALQFFTQKKSIALTQKMGFGIFLSLYIIFMHEHVSAK